MISHRAARAALPVVFVALAALSAMAGRAGAQETRLLRVRALGPAWEGGAATIAVEPRVSPPSPRLALMVFAGRSLLAELTLPTDGGVVTFSIAGLPAGRQELQVKSGSLSGQVTLRVLPKSFGPLAAALLVGLLAVSARLSARRHLPPGSTQEPPPPS